MFYDITGAVVIPLYKGSRFPKHACEDTMLCLYLPYRFKIEFSI